MKGLSTFAGVVNLAINLFATGSTGLQVLRDSTAMPILISLFMPGILLALFSAPITMKLNPIASIGATSMDTTFPVIIRPSGKEYLIHSMMHGLILTILVPFLVSLAIQFV